MNEDKKKKRILAKTLGCKLNYAETSAILDRFVQDGWEIAADDDVPDLVIVHTCAVTGQAAQKSRQQIRKMIKKYPQSRIAAVGCYSQLRPDDLENIDGIDVILGSKEKFAAEKYIKDYRKTVYRAISSSETMREAEPAHSMIHDRGAGRTRAFLKIQDGCDYGCAYCTIPLARGRSRPVPFQEVVSGASRLAAAGYREIVLTGVNIADYHSGTATIVELLEELDRVDIDRIRISSVEPDLLSDRLIETVASSSRIMPHFHLPLQSGSDSILAAMRRRYTAERYKERFLRAAGGIPDCAIGADVITGYPGETDADFQATYSLLEDLPAAYLHVFTCSIRPDTVLERQVSSGERQRVAPAISRSRSEALLVLAEMKQREFTKRYLGRKLDVLFEECGTAQNGDKILSGYSGNYLRVNVKIQGSCDSSDIVGTEKSVWIENMSTDLILEGRFVT